jgi:hypothetical protein
LRYRSLPVEIPRFDGPKTKRSILLDPCSYNICTEPWLFPFG